MWIYIVRIWRFVYYLFIFSDFSQYGEQKKPITTNLNSEGVSRYVGGYLRVRQYVTEYLRECVMVMFHDVGKKDNSYSGEVVTVATVSMPHHLTNKTLTTTKQN